MKILLALAAALALSPAGAEPRNPLDALRLEALAATRERPLFRPGRRPPAPPPVAAPAPEPPAIDIRPVAFGPPPFDLVGAVVGADTAVALLRDRASNEIVRLRQGDDAQGWRVARIDMRTVTLERDGRMQSLSFAPPSAEPGAEVAGEPQQPESAAAPVADIKRLAGRPRDR